MAKTDANPVPDAPARTDAGSAAFELPDVARDARLILAVTDDGHDPRFESARRAAISIAADLGAELIFYDHAAESKFVDPYRGGSVAADIDDTHGESLLDESVLRTLGRAYLADQIQEAELNGVRAKAWLPLHTGPKGIEEGVERFGADVVVVPDEMPSDSITDRVRGRPIHSPAIAAALTVPTLVVGADGMPRLAAGWRVDVGRSKIGFMAHQLQVLPVHGEFKQFEIELDLDEDDPTKSSVLAVIDATSITTGLGVRDAQLKGPSFLDVARYPEIRFTSLSIEPTTDGYRIEGDLEIKGFARLVQLDSRIAGPEEAPEGGRSVRFQATTEIDWREWALHGRWFVSPGLRIEIDVTALAPVGSVAKVNATHFTARPD